MEELFRQIIAYRSTTGAEESNKAILDFLSSYLAERGMHIAWYEKNGYRSFVATVTPNHLTPKLLLIAHADVVPAADNLFELQKRDNKYYGRGVLDMKFAIATFLQLVDDLKDNLQAYDFGIMITTDEEVGGMSGTGHLVDEIGYRPAVAVIPDGGMDWKIETFAKGVHWIDLAATGITAHASRPWEGDHAVHKLLEAVTEIRALYPYTGNRKDTLLSIGTITGGEAANQIAQEAHATIDVRTGSLKDHEDVIEKVTEIAGRYGISMKLLSAPPCINTPENPYIKAFHSLITHVTGTRYDYSFSFAATDGRFFSAHGIPCVIVQPPGGSHHSSGEWLSVEGFEQYYEILLRYTKEIATN